MAKSAAPRSDGDELIEEQSSSYCQQPTGAKDYGTRYIESSIHCQSRPQLINCNRK